ncbi:MAG TPA: double zinc ribbon domain-containing protein [Candidatus Megaira endosymbiont of Hartmannula sinica]|nr:double zinc ribbon domain-containing protein [Candidatus Megaera endosymbiont of Hartmannula sinica]
MYFFHYNKFFTKNIFKFKYVIKKLLHYIINFLYPAICIKCKNYTFNNGLCGKCFGKIEFISSKSCNYCGKELKINSPIINNICEECFNSNKQLVHSNVNYQRSVSIIRLNKAGKQLIYEFKYSYKDYYGLYFARLFVLKYSNIINETDILTYVPSHKIKTLLRKYNSAQIFAEYISGIANKKIIKSLLIKSKYTKSQTTLNKVERKKNIQGSIVINQKIKHQIKDKNILIVDDVITTGFTINYCKDILKYNSACNRIFCGSIARNR